ncbi:MAG: Uma2 family endonuclease [Gemmatimonadota bacterium]
MGVPDAETTERLYTLSEYEQLPDEDGYWAELVEGRLVREPRPNAEHSWIATEMAGRIREHVRKKHLGIALGEAGFLLADDPPTVRGPDVAFIARANLPRGGFPRPFWTVPPDLAVEIVSPSNTRAEIREKVLEYLNAGSRLVWVVEPRDRSVTTYRSRTDVQRLTGSDTLDGHDVLPGFRLEVADVFTPPDFPPG